METDKFLPGACLSDVIVGVAVTKTAGSFSVSLRRAKTINTEPKREFIHSLVHNGDMEVDRNGAD